jgi:hypothetical protein
VKVVHAVTLWRDKGASKLDGVLQLTLSVSFVRKGMVGEG